MMDLEAEKTTIFPYGWHEFIANERLVISISYKIFGVL